MRAPITPTQAWAVIAESAGWNAKDLPVLPEPQLYEGIYSDGSSYGFTAPLGATHVVRYWDEDDMQSYGAACAAHAREMALSDSIETLESLWHSSDDGTRKCIAELEQLKARK